MLELIAVLVVMALATWGAIAMYQRTVDKHKADTLYNDIRTRFLLSNERKQRQFSTELGNESTFGHPIEINRDTPVAGYNKLTVENVDVGLCKFLLKKDWPEGSRIYLNGNVYPTFVDECPSGKSAFSIVSRSAMAKRNAELQKACNGDMPCDSCERCLNGECVPWCPEGEVCWEREDVKSCVPGTCNDGLCCPTERQLCAEGEVPEGTSTQCPCDEPLDCGECGECGICNQRTGECDYGNGAMMCNSLYSGSKPTCNINNGACQQCTMGKFKDKNNSCNNDCSTLQLISVNSAADCHACTDRYMDLSSRCLSCNYTGAQYTSSQEQARCPQRFGLGGNKFLSYLCKGTVTTDQKKCYLNCDENFFSSYGSCADCNSTTRNIKIYPGYSAEEAYEYCSRCSNRVLMWTGSEEYHCVIRPTGNGEFLDSQGDLKTCSSASIRMGWQVSRNKAYVTYNQVRQKCLECPGVIPTRYISNDYCYQCSDTSRQTIDAYNAECISQCKGIRYVSGTNQCTLCPASGTAEWNALTADQKSQCSSATACEGREPTGCEKTLSDVNGECVVTEYQDAGYVCDTNKQCNSAHECVCTGYMNNDECLACPEHATCDGITFTCDTANNWYPQDGACVYYEFTCQQGRFKGSSAKGGSAGCQVCNSNNGFWVTNEIECMACNTTTNPRQIYQRADATDTQKMCGLITCPNGRFPENGWCSNCNDAGARKVDDTTRQCTAPCGNKRRVVGNWCYNCGENQFFYQGNTAKLHEGKCENCSASGDRLAPAEACALCGERWRKMSGDQCVCAGYVEGNTCIACPDHAICENKKIIGCEAGYQLEGNACMSCPSNATCSNGEILCNTGFYLDSEECKVCPVDATACENNAVICPAGLQWNGSICSSCPAHATCDGENILCDDGYYLDENACHACPEHATCSNNVVTCDVLYNLVENHCYAQCSSTEWTELVFDNHTLSNRKVIKGTCRNCDYSEPATTISKEECRKCAGYRVLTDDMKGGPKCWYCGASNAYNYPTGNNLDEQSCNACLNRHYENGKCICNEAQTYNSNKCCKPGERANDAHTGCVPDV